MSLFAVTKTYSVQIYELSADLKNKDQVTKSFFDGEYLRASITSSPIHYMSNQAEPAHACLAEQWLPEIKRKLEANQSRCTLYLIIEKSTYENTFTVETIRCIVNHKFGFSLRSTEPLFRNSGNPIAVQAGIAEISINSTISITSNVRPESRAFVTEACLDEKIDNFKEVIKLLQNIREVTCMDEPLVTILNNSFRDKSGPWVFLQMWEIMKDGDEKNKVKRCGVVSHLGINCKDSWLSPRTKYIDKDHPQNMTELQREFRNALAHMDMRDMKNIIEYVNESDSEKLKDIRLNNHEQLTRMMIQSLRSDIFNFLFDHTQVSTRSQSTG